MLETRAPVGLGGLPYVQPRARPTPAAVARIATRARGLTAAKEKLAEGGFPSIDKAFMAVGTAMMSSMGGASGAIFGTLFRAGGKALKGQEVFDSAGLATFLQAAVQGVQDRGKAEVGDKTVVDAMVPAAEKAKGTSEGNLTEALAAAADAAEGGKEASKDMVAKFGRAKTLGDGAVGHPDAGALSFTIIMQAMRDYVNE